MKLIKMGIIEQISRDELGERERVKAIRIILKI